MEQARSIESFGSDDSNSSGISWSAVIAGAFVAAALSLALLALGAGIGFSAVSPWANIGASARAIGWTAIVWLVLMQIISSSLGGYLAGRLRTKWVRVHTHEVYFRDTAHGFLVWAVGLVIAAAFLTSAATSIMGGAERRRATEEEASGQTRSEGVGPNAYFVDMLLRTNASSATQNDASAHAEVGLILANALRNGAIPPSDRSYLTQVVVARTGVSESEAEKRVDDVYSQDQLAADTARKAIAHAMYWTFLALLMGAFCASLAATLGGKERDNVIVV